MTAKRSWSAPNDSAMMPAGLLAEARRLEAGAGRLGVGVGVARQDRGPDVVLEESQAASRRGVVGVGHAPGPEGSLEHLVVPDDRAADELDEGVRVRGGGPGQGMVGHRPIVERGPRGWARPQAPRRPSRWADSPFAAAASDGSGAPPGTGPWPGTGLAAPRWSVGQPQPAGGCSRSSRTIPLSSDTCSTTTPPSSTPALSTRPVGGGPHQRSENAEPGPVA